MRRRRIGRTSPAPEVASLVAEFGPAAWLETPRPTPHWKLPDSIQCAVPARRRNDSVEPALEHGAVGLDPLLEPGALNALRGDDEVRRAAHPVLGRRRHAVVRQAGMWHRERNAYRFHRRTQVRAGNGRDDMGRDSKMARDVSLLQLFEL